MTPSADVIRRKYARLLIEFGRSANSFVGKDVAIFALQLALEDLDEVWLDEYACLERRVALATETASELGRELQRRQESIETLRSGLQQVMIENDALEAECNRLRFSDELARKFGNTLDELAPVRSAISECLLPHIAPYGAVALGHLPDGHWAEQERLLGGDGAPIYNTFNTYRFIELAGLMLSHLQDARAYLESDKIELTHQRDYWKQTCLDQEKKGSLSVLSAETGLPAPGAWSTSKPTAPILPSPVGFSSGNGAAGAPASSAPTPKLRRSKKNPLPAAESAAASAGSATGNPLTGGEVGETTSPNPTPSPWLAEATEISLQDVEDCIEALKAGRRLWRSYSRPLRLAILAEMWQPEWERQRAFDKTRPGWMPTAGALAFLSTSNRWGDIVRSIIELRIQLSASS